MFISQITKLEGTTVVEKITGARTVAYVRFSGMNEVGRRIWMVRDWLLGHGIGITGSPSCIFSPAGRADDGIFEICAALEDCLCEVQWDLPAAVQRNAAGKFGQQPPRNGGAGENTQTPGLRPEESIKIKRVRPERVLSAIHRGDTEMIDGTLQFLEQALKEGGYEQAGPRREIYLFDVCLPKSMWVTEIQVPVRKREPPQPPAGSSNRTPIA